MKLYDSPRAPNPRRVRVFLAEKGVDIPLIPVDLAGFEHRTSDFSGINPLQRTPALVLDDGTVLTESMAICRYIEELFPEPPLFGSTPLERACVEMWNRRVELGLFAAVTAVFRHLHPGMASHETPQVAAWGEANRPRVTEALDFLDDALSRTPYLAGDTFSVADITLLCAVDFMKPTRMTVPDACVNLVRWHQSVSKRPSALA